jgi:DNA-binding MarR family transcriptional regulator
MGPVTEPLARLLAMALRTMIDPLHERLQSAGWEQVRPLWGFVLLAVRDAPHTTSEIGELMGVTKQAAAKVVAGLADAGLTDERPDPQDRRAKRISLSADGRRFLAEVEAIYAEIEADWAAIIGRARLEQLRSDLSRILHMTHGGQLPPVRPTL